MSRCGAVGRFETRILARSQPHFVTPKCLCFVPPTRPRRAKPSAQLRGLLARIVPQANFIRLDLQSILRSFSLDATAIHHAKPGELRNTLEDPLRYCCEKVLQHSTLLRLCERWHFIMFYSVDDERPERTP